MNDLLYILMDGDFNVYVAVSEFDLPICIGDVVSCDNGFYRVLAVTDNDRGCERKALQMCDQDRALHIHHAYKEVYASGIAQGA